VDLGEKPSQSATIFGKVHPDGTIRILRRWRGFPPRRWWWLLRFLAWCGVLDIAMERLDFVEKEDTT